MSNRLNSENPPDFWQNSREYLLMCFEVNAAFWLNLSGICNPRNKWGRNLLYYTSAGQYPTARFDSCSLHR